MVLQAERYPGGYQQNNYSAQQGPDGYYRNFQEMTAAHTTPYSTYPQVSTYPSSHASQYQSSWSNGTEEYYGNGPSHPVKPSTGGYGNLHGYGSTHGYDNSFNHGSLHGHGHGHGSPNGSGKPHGYGNSHGYGGGATNHFEKPTHGHGYGAPGPNYGHAPSGMNHGYQKPSWTLKGLEDDE